MDFYLTTSASTLPCFQITWIVEGKYTTSSNENIMAHLVTLQSTILLYDTFCLNEICGFY